MYKNPSCWVIPLSLSLFALAWTGLLEPPLHGNSFPSTWYSESEKSLGDNLVGPWNNGPSHHESTVLNTENTRNMILYSCCSLCSLEHTANLDVIYVASPQFTESVCCEKALTNMKKIWVYPFHVQDSQIFHLTCGLWSCNFLLNKETTGNRENFHFESFFFSWRPFGTPKGKLHRFINRWECCIPSCLLSKD